MDNFIINKTLKSNLPDTIEGNQIHFTEDGGIYISNKEGKLVKTGIDNDFISKVNDSYERQKMLECPITASVTEFADNNCNISEVIYFFSWGNETSSAISSFACYCFKKSPDSRIGTLYSISSDGKIHVNHKSIDGWTGWEKIITNKQMDNLSNPNLLINGDFKVWQRGESMTVNSVQYCADRMFAGYVNATHIGKISKQEYGMLFEFSSWATKRVFEYYHLVPSDIIKPLRGKTVTASCKIDTQNSVLFESMTEHITYFFSSSDENECGISCSKNRISNGGVRISDLTKTDGLIKITFDVPNNASALSLRFGVVLESISDDELSKISTCKLAYNYFKLEVGDIATPLTPKTYAEELDMCKRYYQEIMINLMQPTYNNYRNISLKSGFTEMRNTPTIKFIKGVTDVDGYVHKTGVGDVKIGTSSHFDIQSNYGVYAILYDESNQSFLDSTQIYWAKLGLDSEIY